MIKTDAQGRIVADLGIQWGHYRDDTSWWSIDPHGYVIDIGNDGLWHLTHRPRGYYSRVAFQTIFKGHTIRECQRVAEIFDVMRIVP